MRRSWWWLSPLFILGLATNPGQANGTTPALPAPASTVTNGRILFTHCEDPGGCQIYTANPDGSAVDQVTEGEDSFQGDWSPDGKRIVYAGLGSGDLAIWIIDADGTDPHQLTPDDPDSDDLWPRFTADGRWILFTNCRGSDCDGGISAVRPDGSGLHRVTANSHRSYNLADRAPKGSRLTYMRWHVGGVKMAIYVSDARGRHQHRISPPRLQGWWPDWSPTGRRIVFTSQVFGDRPSPRVFTVRPTGSHLKQVTHTSRPHADVSPAYSPTGRKILFSSDRRYDDFCCSDLFVVNAAGGPVTRVHLPFDAYEPRWGTAALEPARITRSADRPHRRLGGSPCVNVPELSSSSETADRGVIGLERVPTLVPWTTPESHTTACP
jgi:Tol biopolymer transport system component